jgi:hypothetical protein
VRGSGEFWVRLMGAGAWMVSVSLFFLFVVNAPTRRIPGTHNLASFIWPALYFAFVGIGLFRLRIWSAVLFALPLAAIAIWLTIGTIRAVPLPWTLINVLFAAMLMTPTIVLIRFRSVLRWP